MKPWTIEHESGLCADLSDLPDDSAQWWGGTDPEYWFVTNGERSFRCSSEADANWLLGELQAPAPGPAPVSTPFKPGTLVMDGPRIGVFVKPLDEGRVLVQFSGPLPECVRETELVLLSEEILKAVRRLKGEAESADERIGIAHLANELIDLGLL